MSEWIAWVALGGTNDHGIGGNCGLLIHGDDSGAAPEILMVDDGFKFEDGHGKSYPVLDDFLPYIKGVLLTHSHGDHIGGISLRMPRTEVYPPIYGSQMTINVLEHNIEREVDERIVRGLARNVVAPRESFRVGGFEVEPVLVSHSSVESYGYHVKVAGRSVFFTGDFKWDLDMPLDSSTDVARLIEIGNAGLDVLFPDSTGADNPGFTPKEWAVAADLEKLVRDNPQVTEFIMPIGATAHQHIAMLAAVAMRTGLPIVYEGKGLDNSLLDLFRSGYEMEKKYHGCRIVPANSALGQEIIGREDRRLCLGTGAQGEENAFFAKALRGCNYNLRLDPVQSMVVNLSGVIPGNEKTADFIFEKCRELGIRQAFAKASGHGASEDLLCMSTALRPGVVIPLHGDRKKIAAHVALQQAAGHEAVATIGGQVLLWRDGAVLPETIGFVDTARMIARETGFVRGRNIYQYMRAEGWSKQPENAHKITLPTWAPKP